MEYFKYLYSCWYFSRAAYLSKFIENIFFHLTSFHFTIFSNFLPVIYCFLTENCRSRTAWKSKQFLNVKLQSLFNFWHFLPLTIQILKKFFHQLCTIKYKLIPCFLLNIYSSYLRLSVNLFNIFKVCLFFVWHVNHLFCLSWRCFVFIINQ